MWNAIKNVFLVLGAIAAVYGVVMFVDRYQQNAKPNIHRFVAPPGFPNDQAELDQFTQFLHDNVGKRVYIDATFRAEYKGAANSVDPPQGPRATQPLNVRLGIDDCRKQCSYLDLFVSPTGDVEEHLFIITPVLYQVRGYFLDVDTGGRDNADFATLKPISAQSVLS
jgi:hypothetical protein